MKFTQTLIKGMYSIDISKAEDERGFFARTFSSSSFADKGLASCYPERSISFNKSAGTLRGMHFQRTPFAEEKIVRCVSGSIFDVTVDLRTESATFGQWFGKILSAENHAILYIPQGCAHGFQTLVDNTEVYYEISRPYVKQAATGLSWNDPQVGIKWPRTPTNISHADTVRPSLADLIRDKIL